MDLLVLFKRVGHVLVAIFRFSQGHGLTDKVIEEALSLVQVAALRFVTNDEKRAFVVGEVKKMGVPTSIANLAVELAVQEAKRLASL